MVLFWDGGSVPLCPSDLEQCYLCALFTWQLREEGFGREWHCSPFWEWWSPWVRHGRGELGGWAPQLKGWTGSEGSLVPPPLEPPVQPGPGPWQVQTSWVPVERGIREAGDGHPSMYCPVIPAPSTSQRFGSLWTSLPEAPHGSWCSGEYGLAHVEQCHQGAKQCIFVLKLDHFSYLSTFTPTNSIAFSVSEKWWLSNCCLPKMVANKWLSILVSKVTPFSQRIFAFGSLTEF